MEQVMISGDRQSGLGNAQLGANSHTTKHELSNKPVEESSKSTSEAPPTQDDGGDPLLPYLSPLEDRDWFHGGRDMISEFHLGPMYDMYFRPYMVPDGKPLQAAHTPKMATTCDAHLAFLKVPPTSDQLQEERVLSALMGMDVRIAEGPRFDHPDALSGAFGPSARELPRLEQIPSTRFQEVFRNLRPGEYHNYDRTLVGLPLSGSSSGADRHSDRSSLASEGAVSSRQAMVPPRTTTSGVPPPRRPGEIPPSMRPQKRNAFQEPHGTTFKRSRQDGDPYG